MYAALLPMSLRTRSRDQFVDLDLPMWAWLALAATIALMLGTDLFRHRVPHEPTPVTTSLTSERGG